MPLFFIFIIVPLVELMLLIEVGSVIGSGWTFIIIIATAIIGTKLVKQQGLHTWQKIQQELATGALPAQSMFDGICILISGILLITPGFITDVIGMLLLTPPFRAAAYKQVGHRIKVQGAFGGQSGFGGQSFGGQTFEHEDNPYRDTDQSEQKNEHLREEFRQTDSTPKVIEGDFERKD
jgi:UPF0716 protein FxsA